MKDFTTLLLATLLVFSAFSLALAQEKPAAALGRVVNGKTPKERAGMSIADRLAARLGGAER